MQKSLICLIFIHFGITLSFIPLRFFRKYSKIVELLVPFGIFPQYFTFFAHFLPFLTLKPFFIFRPFLPFSLLFEPFQSFSTIFDNFPYFQGRNAEIVKCLDFPSILGFSTLFFRFSSLPTQFHNISYFPLKIQKLLISLIFNPFWRFY
jgi:hypothetical protein